MNLTGLVALALLLHPPSSADRLEEILEQMKKAGERLHTLTATFEQTDQDSILQESDVSQGRLYLKLPGRIRWEYEAPSKKILVVRDDLVRLYNPASRQVQEFDRSKGGTMGGADLLVGFGKSNSTIGKNYDVSLVSEDEGTVVLELVPKPDSAASLFTRIELTLDKKSWTPVRSVFHEPNRDRTDIRFSRVELDVALPDSTFELDLPANVEVIRS
ncbi:MAG TPA: outer membrane lipoprotein carrier protein LolA [Vicinamibacteria bacterium]|nr:outer membrane lipoprotein carrier protein LolA [Vicinamibacteria bacterium]